MRILKAALNHRYAVIAALCFAVGGFGLGLFVANNHLREIPAASPVANQSSTREIPAASPTPKQNATPESKSKNVAPGPKAPLSVVVVTKYPGMPAEIMERDITERIKRWVSQAEGVQRVQSGSVTGLSFVIVQFEQDIDAAVAIAQVNSLALSTLNTLPPGTSPPLVVASDPAVTTH